MNKEVYCIVGNKHYLADLTTREVYVFDSVGTLLSDKGAIADMMGYEEVNFISVLSCGVGTYGKSEVKFGSFKCEVNDQCLRVVSVLARKMPYKGVPYRVTLDTDRGKLVHIILVVNKGKVTNKDIDDALSDYGKLSWDVI